jgi:signal transduction histidine kinase
MKNTLLLVDDEEGIRKILGISLEDVGYHVLRAASGEEALSILRQSAPSIVLTDIKMPGMDGIELLQKIKEESPNTEVIMITGHGDLDLAIKSLQFDAADFITKPINDDALDIALKRAKERIWMRRQIREHTEDLERLVGEKTRQLLEAERLAAIGQTVATLAHAIKNIIGGLKGGMYVLERGIELDNKRYLRQGWGMLKGNVDKIKNLALDLLNYAKEREPSLELCDPNTVARDVYQLMLSKAKECGVTLQMELTPDLPEIWMDPEGIHCCLVNLVTNAVDACTGLECINKPKEVVLQTTKKNGWGVEYRVTDTGCGMDQETQEKLFRTFFSTKGTKGTGLGLMITRKIIREHGGEIDLDTEEGKGTGFTLKLPERSRRDERAIVPAHGSS